MADFDFLFELSKGDYVVCDTKDLPVIQTEIFNNKNGSNGLINFRIIDYATFKESVLGKVDDECLIELIKNNYNVYYARELIANYYLYRFLNIDDKRYEEPREIIDKYYKVDKVVQTILFSSKIYFINPNLSDNIINLLLKMHNSIIIKNINVKNLTKAYVTECKTAEEEVENLTNTLVKCLKENPDEVYNVYLPSDEYFPYVNRNFSLYNLNYVTDNFSSLYDLDYVKDLINYLDLYNKFSGRLINNYLENVNPSDSLLKLIEVVNKFIKYEEKDYPYFRELFILELKKTKVIKKASANINVYLHGLPNVSEKNYFILGFNQNVIAKGYTDDDFFDDSIKEKFSLPITKNKNEYIKDDFIKRILTMKSLYISYQTDNHLIPSFILDDLKEKIEVEVLNGDFVNDTSTKYARYQTGKYLDEYEVYQKVNPNLANIYEKIYLDEYQSYNNNFNGRFKINNPLILSYTQMDSYSSCKYQYYLKYILKVREYVDPKFTNLGNYFHYMLRNYVGCDIDDEDELKEDTASFLESNGVEPTKQNQYYYARYQTYVKKALEYINMFQKRSTLNDYKTEMEITKEIGSDSITGRIDKMLIQKKEKDNTQKIVVIDYKTGNTIIDLPLIEYGFSLQIPIYFYLLSDTKDTEIIGGYIQKVIPSKIYEYKPNKDYEDNYYDEYRYNGLTVDVEKNISIIDSMYEDEEPVIAGLKIKANGDFSKTFMDRTLTSEEIKMITELVDLKIKQALADIHQGSFEINPKIIDNKTTCSYCKYFSICNKKYSNYVYLKKDKDLSFLRGDKNDTK